MYGACHPESDIEGSRACFQRNTGMFRFAQHDIFGFFTASSALGIQGQYTIDGRPGRHRACGLTFVWVYVAPTGLIGWGMF